MLLDKDNIVSDGYDEEVDETVENAGDDSYVNSHHKDRSANILEETGELLDALGEVEPEKPTPFEKPDLASFSQEKLPDQPKRIKYVIPENIPANKNVKVIIGETQCIFTIPENAIPGQTLTIELPLNPVMVKVRKRTNSIEPPTSAPEKVQQEPDEVDSVSDTSEKNIERWQRKQ